jgi:hypothetical protein
MSFLEENTQSNIANGTKLNVGVGEQGSISWLMSLFPPIESFVGVSIVLLDF